MSDNASGQGSGESKAAKAGDREPSLAKVLVSTVPEFVLIAGAVALYVTAGNFQSQSSEALGPNFWPQMLTVGIGVAALARLVRKLLLRKRPVDQAGTAEDEDGNVRWSVVALAAALVLGYVVGIIFLGYLLATALFLIAFIYLGGHRKWRIIVPLGVLSSVVFVYVFTNLAYLSLPTGVGIFDQFSVTVYRLLGLY